MATPQKHISRATNNISNSGKNDAMRNLSREKFSFLMYCQYHDLYRVYIDWCII